MRGGWPLPSASPFRGPSTADADQRGPAFGRIRPAGPPDASKSNLAQERSIRQKADRHGAHGWETPTLVIGRGLKFLITTALSQTVIAPSGMSAPWGPAGCRLRREAWRTLHGRAGRGVSVGGYRHADQSQTRRRRRRELRHRGPTWQAKWKLPKVPDGGPSGGCVLFILLCVSRVPGDTSSD